MEENNREQLEQINQMGHANEPTGSPAEDLTVSNGDQLLTNGAGVDGTGEGMAEEELVEEFDVFRNVGQGLSGHYREIMIQYWQELINEIEQQMNLDLHTRTISNRIHYRLLESEK